MQQTDDEAQRSIDTYLHDLFYCIREIPALKDLADQIGIRVYNYSRFRGIKPTLVTFGAIYWAPLDGMWKIEPLQFEEGPDTSPIILPPEFTQIKDVITDMPEVAKLVQAIAGQLMPRVRTHKIKGRKISFSKVVWLPDNSILFKAYRKLDNGRLDTIRPEMITLQ
jgi:hypothetical protein